ncbi:MAG: hypothetical protein LQ350_006664 [Teloschistes chrysophthalmus]|nr:MAG: hypothetical protein LQ350_006664 [Niorma chrysophthalma]
MASSSSIYSQTLHNVTHTKLDELEKKRNTFEKHRNDLINTAQIAGDSLQKIETLKEGVLTCFGISVVDGRILRGTSGHPRLETILRNFDRFLAQARYDPSVSQQTLDRWQQDPSDKDSDMDMSGFEHVSSSKSLESRLDWEQGAFTPANVDLKAIAHMLQVSFTSATEDTKYLGNALNALRTEIKEFERDLASPVNFNTDTLNWTIKSLLASDLLADGKRDVLQDFLGHATMLREIADVLNMRIMALDDWSWGHEVLLEKRHQLNGTTKVYMDEDVLQAIFLQYIGLRWSVFWKKALRSFRSSNGVGKISHTPMSLSDRKRREFYLGPVTNYPNFRSMRLAMYRQGYFLSQLPDSVIEENSAEEGEVEADNLQQFDSEGLPRRVRRKLQTARVGQQTQAARRPMTRQIRSCNWSGSTEPTTREDQEDLSGQYKPKNAMDAKQSLLHLLSAEILINTRLQGEITCFRSQIDNLYSSLPHAPLRFADDESSEPRQRKTGVPGSHVLSEVMGEVVLFCLDFQINQETDGELLWRTNDDFWFWSSSLAKCEKAWSVTQHFVNTMGLKVNQSRSGSVRMARESPTSKKIMSLNTGDGLPRGQIRWGMLYLNSDSGRFEIDQSMVDHHIKELGHQLQDKSHNVFAWIKAWNSYAATFFTSNFGKPANSFGQQHVDDMLATHRRVQRQIFLASNDASSLGHSSGSVVEFLKHTIEGHFGTKDIPDGYFYFPTELGGLEVRNPFVGLLQLRGAVEANPDRLLDKFHEAEMEAYSAARSRFYEGELLKDAPSMLDPQFIPADADKFLSFQEYIKHRDSLNYDFNGQLSDVLSTLLKKPEEEAVETDENGQIKLALNELGNPNDLRGIVNSWYNMDAYWKWVVELYGPAMIEKFGGLRIVDPGLLPMGMVSLFKSGRVNWQD